jgi:hypothetical protein
MLRRTVNAVRSSKPVAALGATVVGVVAVLASSIAPAGAAPVTAGLTMYRPTYYPPQGCWEAAGTIPMSNYDAEGYLDNGAALIVELWGDDPIYDNYLVGFVRYENRTQGPLFYASDRGIEWYWNGCLPRTTLDEDWGEDELYVAMAVIDGDGNVLAERNTNIWRTSW